jgi:hypothetical protein
MRERGDSWTQFFVLFSNYLLEIITINKLSGHKSTIGFFTNQLNFEQNWN